MKTRLRFLLCLCLLLVGVSAHSQSADIFIDQTQPVIDNTLGGLAIGGASQQKLAQTVTVGHEGRLRGVYLPIACDSGRLMVEIRNVDPNGTPGSVILSRNVFRAEEITPIGPLYRFFQLEDDHDLFFVTGDRLAIVLQNLTGTCGIFVGPVGDSYTGGTGFFDAQPNPPGWIPFPETRLDLPFMTRMKLR